MKFSILSIIFMLLLVGCGVSTRKQEQEKEQIKLQHYQDSIQLEYQKVNEALLRAKQAKKDSINRIEEKIAISNINFKISQTEFNRLKSAFLRKCKSSSRYKLGEFNFKSMTGSFYENKLHSTVLFGSKVSYDNFDRTILKQYSSLAYILTEKYGYPKEKKVLPKWNEMNKGDSEICASWEFGKKEINVVVYCSGSDYAIWLWSRRKDLSDKADTQRKDKEIESNKKGVDLL